MSLRQWWISLSYIMGTIIESLFALLPTGGLTDAGAMFAILGCSSSFLTIYFKQRA